MTSASTKSKNRDFGSLRQLASGKWNARYSDHGKLMTAGTYATRKLAAEALAATQTKLAKGERVTASGEMVGDYVARWISARRSSDGSPLAPRTVEGYRSSLRKHIEPTLGRIPLRDLTAPLVSRWHGSLDAGPTAGARAYAVLKAAMNTAVDQDEIPKNPCRVRGGASAPTAERQDPADDQVSRILTAVTEVAPRWRAFVVLAARTGLRQGEIAALRRSDLDLDAGTVRVTRSAYRVTGATGLQFKRPKSAAGVRTVPLDAETVAELRAHLDSWSPAPATAADGPVLSPAAIDPPIFVGENWQAITSTLLATKAAELEDRARQKNPRGRQMAPAKRAALLSKAAALRAVRCYTEVPVGLRERGEFSASHFNTAVWHPVCERAGVDPKVIRFHDLRAHVATRLIRSGTPMPDVQKRIGHSTINAAMHYQRAAGPTESKSQTVKLAAFLPPLPPRSTAVARA